MSFDKYSDKAAEAIALIREFAKVEYWDYFKGDPEQALESFCAMQDAAEEMGRMKAQDSAAPQDNVPGVSELPPLPEPLEISWPELHRGALGCGVEDRNLCDRYRAAEYGWEDGVGKAIECVPGKIYDADQMQEYARAALRAYGQRAAVAVLKDEKIIQCFESHIDAGPESLKLKHGECAYWIKQHEMLAFAKEISAAPSQPQQEAVPAEPSEQDKLVAEADLYSIIRGFGYCTSDQAYEIAEAIFAKQQKGG